MSQNNFQAPLTLRINSDGTELVFTGKKGDKYYYKYTKSTQKLGMVLPLTEPQLMRLLQWNEVLKNIKPSK